MGGCMKGDCLEGVLHHKNKKRKKRKEKKRY
jgi:hypothetical protein